MPESIKELCVPHKTQRRHKTPLVPRVAMVTVGEHFIIDSQPPPQGSHPQICGPQGTSGAPLVLALLLPGRCLEVAH